MPHHKIYYTYVVGHYTGVHAHLLRQIKLAFFDALDEGIPLRMGE